MKKLAMRDVLLEQIYQRMLVDSKIFFACADFGSPVLDKIQAEIPERFVNVGIAEQNLINVSVGMALEGYTVFAYAIAPFVTMRCYEQIRVSVSVLSQVRPMNINIIGVGAGVSYTVSGPTHHCIEDLSIMNTLPNIEIFSPSDPALVTDFVPYAISKLCPKYIRLDAQPLFSLEAEKFNPEKGFRILNEVNSSALIVGTGYMSLYANKLSEVINVNVLDLYLVNSYNREQLSQYLLKFNKILVIEEGIANKGGVVSEIHELLSKFEQRPHVLGMGFGKKYHFELGDRETIHKAAGISLVNVQKALGYL